MTAAKQTSWPCILQASKSCRSHSQLKAFRSAIASLKLKRKATASKQDHGKDCKSVAGLGGPRTALNPFVEWPPAQYYFLIWSEGDKQEGGRQTVSGGWQKGEGRE